MLSPSPREREPSSPPERATRSPVRRGLIALLAAALALVLSLLGLGAGDRIEFEHGVELLSASAPRQTSPGAELRLSLRFRAREALPEDQWIFVHAESTSGELGACRMTVDRPPKPPTTSWGGGREIVQELTVRVNESCRPGRLELRAGLYERKRGERLHVLAARNEDDRVFVGSVELVPSDPDSSQVTLSARALGREQRLALLAPWLKWLISIGLTGLLGYLLASYRSLEEDPTATAVRIRSPRWQRRLALSALALPYLLGLLVVLEFVKDDAYISFRYAHNLVKGEGLVFNPGERLEGVTNFLWVLVLAPFEALGLDLFQVCEVLGSALAITCLVLTARLTVWCNGERRDWSQLWGALWLSTSSSFVLYAKSGLEQPLAALLPIAAAFVLYRARERAQAGDAQPKLKNSYFAAGLLAGAGALTRPELHLMAILIALPLVVDVVRARKIGPSEALFAAGALALTAPAHLFRYLYYGTLIPNTFYVKTSTGGDVVWHGLNTLHDMFGFNHTGLLALFAPLAFANRRRLLEKFTFALIALAFMAYYVRVGVDEMHWHRLYLPALPFLCVLAALGLQNVLDAALHALKGRLAAQLALSGLGWVAVLWACASNFEVTYKAQNGFDGHGDLAGTFHPDMGKFLVRHEQPGGLVAFQDMGSTPYYAPDLSFLDFFGLVDGTVARARHAHGLHTFIAGDPRVQRKYDAEMREYFFRRNPEWTILTIYTPRGQERRASELYDSDPTGGSFGALYRENSVQFALWDDRRFRQRYVPVRTWPRSSAYYLSLFRRRDLWDRTPREVVLDAPPARKTQKVTRFEGGLELLGWEMTRETVERHEAFITSYWRLPGPMPADLYFFVHVTRKGMQIPADHVPGDWMYPADRWKAGEILEDRILFQLPPMVMTPGLYSVYIGVYRRSTGQRLAIVEGTDDGDQRVRLGKLRVKPLLPMVHALIPTTDVERMRAHPERITRAR